MHIQNSINKQVYLAACMISFLLTGIEAGFHTSIQGTEKLLLQKVWPQK